MKLSRNRCRQAVGVGSGKAIVAMKGFGKDEGAVRAPRHPAAGRARVISERGPTAPKRIKLSPSQSNLANCCNQTVAPANRISFRGLELLCRSTVSVDSNGISSVASLV